MTNLKNYARVKVPRTSRPFNLEAPRVPKAAPLTGIVKLPDLENDLLVEIPRPPTPEPDVELWILWNDVRYGQPYILTQGDVDDPTILKFDLYIDKNDFPVEGTDVRVQIDYEVNDDAAGHSEKSNRPVTVRFDQRAPGGSELPPMAFTDAQLSGITVDDLVDNAGSLVLPIKIDPFFGSEADDIVELWINDSPDPSTGTWLAPTYTVTDPALGLAVSITEAQLRTSGDGIRYFGYRATDFAGNVSDLSATPGITVYLDLPVLAAPRVPQGDDGLITYNDAVAEVGVEIPPYDGAAVGDSIYVVWGGVDNLPAPLPNPVPSPAPDPLLIVMVPYSVVKQAGDGTDKSVSYWLRRGNDPRVESAETLVNVDLTTPGGEPPDPSLPEHGNIRAPRVKCGTSPDNSITPPDYSKDALATVFRVGLDNDPIWEVGDEIQLHWHNAASPELPVVVVDANNEGSNIEVPVPFTEVIEPQGVGDVEVYFTVSRTLAGNNKVVVKSQVQTVHVASSGQLPGDGNPLVPGFYPEANINTNIINRAAGIDGTTFRIPLNVSNIELSRNPVASYRFVGVATRNEDSHTGEAEIPLSKLEASDVPITQAMLSAGYLEVDLPYSLTYFICRNGAILDYSLKNDEGSTNAIRKFVRFAMNQSGMDCSLPTP